MTPSVSVAGPAEDRGVLRRLWPELLTGLVWLTTALALSGINVSHDVIWQFWIARQLNAGIGLYSWIMEVNPPLWYWMAQPLDLLAAWTGWQTIPILVAVVFALIGLSLTLTGAMITAWSPIQRLALYGAILASLVIVPISDFGQREHLVLIAAIPYALLLAARVEGRRISLALALAIAVLATPMFALKHYLALVPIALELWLIWRLRRDWRPFRPETITLALGAMAYAAAILVFTPDYLTTMVPALRLAYGDLRLNIFAVLLNQMNLLLVMAALYFFHFRRELKPAATAMLVVSATLVLAYYLQFKGWSYHATPAVGTMMLAMVLHLAQRPPRPRLRWTEGTAVALALLIALFPPLKSGSFHNDFSPYTARMLAQAPPGSTAVMLTAQASRIWGMVDQWGLKWPSRYYHFWMLPTIANTLASGEKIEGPLLDVANRMRRETVADFTCNPPYIIIDDGISVDDVDFDVLAFFNEEPSFAALMQSYQVQFTLGPFTVYERIADLPAPTGPCMTLAPAHHIYPRPGAPA